MNIIKYTITFHTYWHCGSGLAAGGDADLLVVKDKDGLPFVPGKTIKGLVREAVDLLHPEQKSTDAYKSVLGITAEPKDESKKGGSPQESYRSDAFFKDATLSDAEREYVIYNKLSEYLYQTISSTAITEEGIADDNTLRKIQVCAPCDLRGIIILDFPENIKKEKIDDMIGYIKDGLKYIKRLGSWRNRGLGRCTISPEEEKGGES